MLGSFFILAAMALPGAAAHPPSIQVVAPHPAAAKTVPIIGATRAEVAATREALARLGRDGPVRRVEFGHQNKGRSISATYSGGRSGDLRNSWLTGLALDDIGTALSARGENVTWIELSGPNGWGTAFQALRARPLDERGLRQLARRIAVRARQQHQPVTEIVAYPVAGGAVRVVIQLSQDEYLRGTNTRWLDVLPDRSDREARYSADVRVLGPGGVRAAEGAIFGSTGSAFGYGPVNPGTAAPIEGPVSLQVTVHRTSPKRRELTFTVDCARQTATCTGFRQNWTMLVPPVVEGSDCLGPFGRDSVTVSGSVAGVPVERSYDICYGRVIQGWEKLLGVAPPSRR